MEGETTIMTVITELWTQVLSWLGDTIDLFMDHPVTLVGVVIGFVGSMIGLTRRLFGGGRRRR